MTDLIALVLGGLATGAIYGSIALTLVIIFRTTGVVNFAQGEMATFTTLIAWSLLQAGVSYAVVVLAVLAVGFVLGYGIERVVIRRFETSSGITPIIATLGVFTVLNGADTFIWGGDSKAFPTPLPAQPIRLGELGVSTRDLSTLAVILIVLGLVYLLLERTHLGLTMRAAAGNRRSAQLAGVDVGRTLAAGWGLAAVIGAVAGLLIAPRLTAEPQMMVGPLLYAFAAAALGGFTSLVGAVLGGLVLGVGQALLASYVPLVGNDLSFPVALALIIAVLLLRPGGLLGRAEVQRV